MPIKKARGILNHKPNLNNIKFILRCFSIVKFDVSPFHLNRSDARLIKIDGEVYIIVMSPVFTFVEKYSRTASEFISDWMKALSTKVEKTPPLPKVPVTIEDRRSKVTITIQVDAFRFMELLND